MNQTTFDPDKFLSQTYYSWNTLDMLSGVVDFLRFSEENLQWLRRRDIKNAEDEGAKATFSPEDEGLADTYRLHLIESAQYRFDVGLSQSIRYSGLVAFITAIELCATVFAKRFIEQVPKPPDGANKHVHLLAVLNAKSRSGFDQHLADLAKLVHLRNCVVHAAGFVESYDKDVRDDATLDGFEIWSEDYLGKSIRIREGAIERFAKIAMDWVPKLDERCTTMGLLK